ncbi:hypothetical protein FM109_13675 [Vibrio casei]|nr:hypothetical protein FM109_13675 [Vibrio casei]
MGIKACSLVRLYLSKNTKINEFELNDKGNEGAHLLYG